MQVRIKNKLLNSSIEFLFNLSLKGKQSRHRTKFINVLTERLTEVIEQQDDLLKEHCYLDDEGKPVKNGDHYEMEEPRAFLKEREELSNEHLVIDDSDSQTMLETLKKVLEEFDDVVQGQEAMTFDYLCNQFGVDD